MANGATTRESYIYDALGDFSKGVNSGLNRFFIPKDQLSFAVNATVRGNFVTSRPPYILQNFTYAVPAIQPGVETALFQGACYYRPDSGSEMLVAQIGGRLFTFTPDVSTTNVPVAEVTIPGDPNPSSSPQAWLRAAERWVIVNNGVNNPVFFNGVSSIRSVPNSIPLATTSFGSIVDQFETPPIGSTVLVNLPAPYGGTNGQSVQVIEYDENNVQTAVSTYAVVQIGGSPAQYNAVFKNLNDTQGATQGAGSTMVVQPGNWGSILSRAQSQQQNPNGTFTNIFLQVGMSAPIPSTAGLGTSATIDGDSSWFIYFIDPTRKVIIFQHPTTIGAPPQPAVGDEVYQSGPTPPSANIGNILNQFIAPAIGASITVPLEAQYTGAIGQIFFLNNKQYQLTSFSITPPAPGANTVTLQNIDDGRLGHIFNQYELYGPQVASATQIWSFPQLPPGRMLAYGMGRVWESLTDGLSFIAGDIVGGSSGSPGYAFRDSVLNVSENTYLAGGGVFRVPGDVGQITGMCFTSQLDASLGQGPLMIVTPGGIFSVNTPVDRTTWQNLTNPILSQSLIGFGGLSQDSTLVVNGDLITRGVDGIRSLLMARREFWSWGNTPISFEMKRVLDKDNVAGLPFASAVQFDNRLLMTAAPTQGPLGVYHPGFVALNFDPVSTIQGKAASVYDGLWTGINVLRVIEGMFNGIHRSFAFTFNIGLNKIQLVELMKTDSSYLDNGATPVLWSFETPMMFRESQGKGFFDLINLEDMEFYVSDIKPGHRVDFKVEYRADFSECWNLWNQFYICNDGTSTQDSYGDRLSLGAPPSVGCNEVTQAPSKQGRWFQFRFTINGHCVWTGCKVKASLAPQPAFKPPVCNEDALPVIATTYMNNQVSTVFCTGGTPTFNGNLPGWITISGLSLVGKAGTFSGDTQANADQAALAALNTFINTQLAAGKLYCANPGPPPFNCPAPDGNLITWTTPFILNSTPPSVMTYTPSSPQSSTLICRKIDYATGANTSVDFDQGNSPDGQFTYNGTGANCNLHVVISENVITDANFNKGSSAIDVYSVGPVVEYLHVDLTTLVAGTYDYPFTLPNTHGTPIVVNLEVFFQMYAVVANTDPTKHWYISVQWTPTSP